MQRRLEMDGLRAVACLIVLVGHSIALNSPDFHPGGIRGIAAIGVWLFFALSAYLLTFNLLRREIRAAEFGPYAVARFMRIVPSFAIALMIYWLLSQGGLNTLAAVYKAMTMQEAYAHFWTVPIEFSAYFVLFPAVWLLSIAERWFGLWAFPIVLISAVGAITASNPPWGNGAHDLSWYTINFASGALGAWVVARFRRLPCRKMVVAAAVGVVAFTFAVKFGLVSDPEDGLLDKHYVYGPLFAVLIAGVATSQSSFLSNRLLVKIGKASYSTYLYHWAILVMLAPWVPLWCSVTIGVGLSILVGEVGRRVIEKPCETIRKHLTVKLQTGRLPWRDVARNWARPRTP